MGLVNNILYISNFILPIVTLARRLRKKEGIEVDHIFLFSCGFIFYLILPIVLAGTKPFVLYSGYPKWKLLFDAIPDSTWTVYFVACLLLYTSFLAGDFFSGKFYKKKILRKYHFDKKLVYVFLTIAISLAIFSGYPMRSYFFAGYSISTQIPMLGSFTAAAILLLSVAFMYSGKVREEFRVSMPFWKTILNPCFIAYFIVATLLFSMGGRMIFISSLLMLMVFYSVYFKRLRLSYLILLFLLIIYLAHFIVIFREGYVRTFLTRLDIKSIAIYLFPENFSVSFSLLDFLSKYSIPILRFPTNLLSGLVSIIPSFVFPTKASFIISRDDLGYAVQSPFGGMNAFVTLMVNFGIIGSMMFLSFISFFLRKWKDNPSIPYSAMYILTSGWLALMFFRDTEQTLTKEILQFAILTPLVIATVSSKLNSSAVVITKS